MRGTAVRRHLRSEHGERQRHDHEPQWRRDDSDGLSDQGQRGRRENAEQRRDEVAAPAASGVLEGCEHLVDGREAARRPLALDRATGHHAVPVEQPLRGTVGAAGRVGVELGQQRLAAGRVGWTAADHARARASRPVRAPPPDQRAERGEGVVADAAGPHEVPQHAGEGVVGGHAAHGLLELAEEPGAAGGQRVEDRLVQLPP